MTSLIRNLKQERWINKRSFKKEGFQLCTKEATETELAVFTTFPLDIGVIKRASNAKLINKRLHEAQQKYFEKNKGELGGLKMGAIAKPNYWLELAKQFLGK